MAKIFDPKGDTVDIRDYKLYQETLGNSAKSNGEDRDIPKLVSPDNIIQMLAAVVTKLKHNDIGAMLIKVNEHGNLHCYSIGLSPEQNILVLDETIKSFKEDLENEPA